MFESYSTVFRQLAEDKKVAQPYLVFRHGDLTTEFGPLQDVPRSQDPVARGSPSLLQAVAGTGKNGHTVIRISMYAWSGEPGPLPGSAGGRARPAGLHRARHPQRSPQGREAGCATAASSCAAPTSTWTTTTRPASPRRPGALTHEKWMALSGTWGGAPYRGVWTGSENWSNASLHNDEIVPADPARRCAPRLRRHFDAHVGQPRVDPRDSDPEPCHRSKAATAGSSRLPSQTRPSCSRTPVTKW